MKYLLMTGGLRTPTVYKDSSSCGEVNILERETAPNKVTSTIILPPHDVKVCLRPSIKARLELLQPSIQWVPGFFPGDKVAGE